MHVCIYLIDEKNFFSIAPHWLELARKLDWKIDFNHVSHHNSLLVSLLVSKKLNCRNPYL